MADRVPGKYGNGNGSSLTGIESTRGRGAGFLALVLAAYAWQALAKPRVRLGIAAAFGLVVLAFCTIFPASSMGDSELAELGVDGPQRTRSVDVSNGPISIGVDVSSDDEDNLLANADRVEPEVGLQIATLAGLAAFVPVALLWRDDRARRRKAGLLI